MASPGVLGAVEDHLARRGFDLAGRIRAGEFDARAPAGHRLSEVRPGVRSALVFGTGGPAFWRTALDPREVESAIRADRSGAPAVDLIDRRTEEVCHELEAIVRRHGSSGKCEVPFGPGARRLSFPRLAEAAGLGTTRTVLGILIHPRFGPWVSLRGVLLADFDVEPAPRPEPFDPCAGCPAPCLAACPAGAFHRDRPWDLGACAAWIASTPDCVDVCRARAACVVAPEARYSGEESRHRHRYFREALLASPRGKS